MSDDRRAMLESIAFGDDERVTPADRLRAIGELRELDRDEQTARFTRQASEPYVERDPDRIERILELALLHVGSPIIEARAGCAHANSSPSDGSPRFPEAWRAATTRLDKDRLKDVSTLL